MKTVKYAGNTDCKPGELLVYLEDGISVIPMKELNYEVWLWTCPSSIPMARKVKRYHLPDDAVPVLKGIYSMGFADDIEIYACPPKPLFWRPMNFEILF